MPGNVMPSKTAILPGELHLYTDYFFAGPLVVILKMVICFRQPIDENNSIITCQ